MNSVRIGWNQASRWQRLAIVTSAVVVVGTLAPREPLAAPTPTVAAFISNPTPRVTTKPAPDPTARPTVAPPSGATPTPRPTVRPTLSPDPTEAPPLSVKRVSLTGSVCGGCTASVRIKTASKARCTIDVVYDSGSSTAAGLVAKTAKSNGNVSWSWTVGTRTAVGTYPIYVSCEKGDRSGDLTLHFKVR